VSGTALVVAHPGHEILLYNLLETTRPRVFVLTDGSGRSGVSRIESTSKLLREIGIRRGALFGQLTDQEVYRALIDHDHALFCELVDQLAESFADSNIHSVVTDAAEGYCSTHDICHLMTVVAASIAERKARRSIDVLDYAVVGRPDPNQQRIRPGIILRKIDDQAFQRKIKAARTFYPDLIKQLEQALDHPDGESAKLQGMTPLADNLTGGLNDFRTECLRPIDAAQSALLSFHGIRYYETHGEASVRAGHYQHVIRFDEHILPLIEDLQQHAVRTVHERATSTHN